MSNRSVRARPTQQQISEFGERLESGEIERFGPFEHAITRALDRARFDSEIGEAVWIEEDYCSPPLAMERAEVLDDYVQDITIAEEDVDEAVGWQQVDDLPEL